MFVMASQVQVIVNSSEKVLEEISLVRGQKVVAQAMEGVTYQVQDLVSGNAPSELVITRSGNDLELVQLQMLF